MLNTTRTAALCALAATLAIGSPAGAARSCEFRGAFGTRSSEPERPRPVRFLTDVRAGAHRCFDRAAFEFQTEGAEPPGYRVGYEDGPIREDGSGRPVPVRGDAFLVVRLSPARDTDISTADSPRSTYRGPDSVEPRGGRRIIEVRHVSSFEGTVKWAIGVDRRRPFRVTTLPSPPRIVIDVG